MVKRAWRFTYTILIAVFIIGISGRLNAIAAVSEDTEEEKILSVDEIMLLAAAMELENGMNSDRCVLLTGSVILNRMNSPEWPDTIYGVLHQKGQYAKHTVDNLYTVKVTGRVLGLALRLVVHGSIDKEIIFQSMHPHLGKVKYKVDTEYFATGR